MRSPNSINATRILSLCRMYVRNSLTLKPYSYYSNFLRYVRTFYENTLPEESEKSKFITVGTSHLFRSQSNVGKYI